MTGDLTDLMARIGWVRSQATNLEDAGSILALAMRFEKEARELRAEAEKRYNAMNEVQRLEQEIE